MAIRLGIPAVVVAALVFAAATLAMFAAEELDALLAALVGGLLLATPVPWDWGPYGDDTGYVALWETPRLVAVSDAAPLVPYVSDTLD
jgi:hypothetical protein